MNKLRLLMFTFLLAVNCLANADVRLPRLVSDGLVLQREKPVTLWGWADEGEQVSVSLGQQTLTTKAVNGRWQLVFKPLKTGPAFQIHIKGKNELTINKVLAGDVWVAAGQSNMELPINRVLTRYPDIIQTTNLPDIREFAVPIAYNFKGPQDDYAKGQWKTATPENLGGFSAVGFFFARDLYQKYHVPIGLIMLPVGGSPLEAWVSEDVLQAYPHYLAVTQQLKDDSYLQKLMADDKTKVDAWYTRANTEDKGHNLWNAEHLAEKDWQTLKVPGLFRDQNIDFVNGVVWLRKSVTLTAAQAQKSARLFLGAIVDGDEVYVNGQLVGQTGYQYPPRIYKLAPGVLKAGENQVSVRLTSYSSNPGFVKDKLYALDLGDEKIDLSGDWKYKVGMRSESFPKTTTIHYQPAGLFNAKLAPALHSAIKGVIWYQGESNTDRAAEYARMFPELINDWRKQFHQGNFPFLFVQLPNFMAPSSQPGESDWADLRDAQRSTLRVKNTVMVVAIDVGEWNDIHPLNKQVIGERLSLAAQKLAYGDRKVMASGPIPVALEAKKNGLLVKFSKAGGAPVFKGDDKLHRIEIAGADHKYVWAEAKIQGQNIFVWSDQIPNPKSLRYAWADNPEGANLYNAAGLPASPFQLSLKP